MKLLFLADGTRIHTRNVIAYFYEKGYEIELISPTIIKNLDIKTHLIKNCKKENGEFKKYWYFFQARKIQKIIREINPDILHALFVTNYGFIGAYSQFHPFIVTAYGTDILRTPGKNTIYRLLTKYCLHRADLITAVAPHLVHKIKQFNIPASKILTFRYFVDNEKFSSPTNNKNLTPERYTVLSTRKMDQNANLKTLMEAVPKVLQKKKNVWFVFLGDDEANRKLQKLARQLNVIEHVAFPGEQPYTKMNRFYQQADIFVSVSFVDGMPQALLEAMACGVFPVVSKIPGNEFWIQDGVDGFCVPPTEPDLIAQKIIDAIENPQIRKQAAKLNIQKIKKLPSFDKNLETLEYYYFQLQNDFPH